MSLKIERISEEKCQLGESPFWDEKTQTLYYIDIFARTVNRYNPSTKSQTKAVVGEKNVSFIIPVQGQNNTFVIGYGNEIAKIVWDGVSDKIESLETVAELKNTDERKHRFNDGKADPSGRLWAGIFTSHTSEGFSPKEKGGTLYALKTDKTLAGLTSGITLTNGLTWNEKINKFYYIDSIAAEVYEFDYKDLEITNKKVLFSFRETGVEGGPDGMTIDTDGNLWIACFGSSKVIKIDPKKTNTLLQIINMPVPQVTCVEFAGANYEDLYVTTAGVPWAGEAAPEGGWTYKITGLGVRGLPAREVKL